MSKYQNTCEPEDFPLSDDGDTVALAAYLVMVEGHTTVSAARIYGVTPGAVCMRCKRIADGLRDVRMKLHAAELYDLACQAFYLMARQDDKVERWADQLKAISQDVERSQ